MVSHRAVFLIVGSLDWNKIGDGGAGAVAAAAGTMPCLETLRWVLIYFPLYLSFPLSPLSHQSLPLLEGHVMEDSPPPLLGHKRFPLT